MQASGLKQIQIADDKNLVNSAGEGSLNCSNPAGHTGKREAFVPDGFSRLIVDMLIPKEDKDKKLKCLLRNQNKPE